MGQHKGSGKQSSPTPPLDGDTVLRLHPAVSHTRVDDEIVLYHAGSDSYLVLNESAALIVESIDGSSSLNDLIGTLTNAFDVDRDTASEHIVTFLHVLIERHLVTP